MPAITITAILKAKEGKEDALRTELEKVLAPSRAEEGCIEYTLHESLEEKEVFVFYETWENEEALQQHIQSTHYQTYRENTSDFIESRQVFKLRKTV
ncbi:putative quinol monooxygenase [Metabacillus idriensis]|uniref:putative quinol monooxygenase n=1 Tax=Metabacillus idriensis TaxID=324768 RepID=UPI0028147A02|nr:putative quinol monooxygenase [Metabacillus idriensis]MDR0136227.1 putative quinol monooxygenase [Metabacillus idriensis]